MSTLFDYIARYMRLFRLSDIIDMAIVAILTYQLLKLIKETRAVQLVKGVAILFLVLQLSIWFKLTALNFILQTTMQVGMFAIVVIFQPELRSILERMGRSKVGKLMDFATNPMNDEEFEKTINELVEAATNLSKTKTGALIIIERDTKLGEIMKTGTVLNADVSASLLENIFFPNTPLHDGAVIVRGNKVMTAGCFLPLTSNNNISRELGTRHRAALGISEVSDSVALIVSEETGKISIAINGTLTRNIVGEPLKKALSKILSRRNTPETFDKIKFWKVMSK